EGASPTDLRNINGLNHYIGMHAIEPDQIAELRYMPVIVGALLVTGLLVALLGRRSLLFGWLGLYLAVALAGLADFWKWEYEYGHNLDPTAAIRIPGMAYQPPLIGGKQMLNFHASSWPDVGGLAAILSLTVVLVVGFMEFRRWRRICAGALASATAMAVAAACAAPAPRTIAYDSDECAHCHMTIAEPRLAAELVTRTGKTFVFDDPGCLADFLAAGRVDASAIHSLWVADYTSTEGRLLPADEAYLVHSDAIRTPMDHGLAATPSAAAAESLRRARGGEVVRWADVALAVAGAES
ncbi:MAG TPA: nitrous oxide reductase accessory protein NosL, partial [Gemmatimonadales bacterium]|nr:nitrous oxide reductase accessory protein NosL [Gemmatimonadales bacterium]